MISKKRMLEVEDLVGIYGMKETCRRLQLPRVTVVDYLSRLKRIREKQIKKPRVLLVDIETTPIPVYVWQLRNNKYIHMSQVIYIPKDWNMICWCGKWLYTGEKFGAVQTPTEAKARDDRRIVEELWEYFNKADIIIGHNIDGFDKKKATSRFVYHRLGPPSPYLTIDTLKVANRELKEPSHKLDYLTQKYGLGAKYETGFELWLECEKGNEKALKHMYEYCGNDVDLLESLYILLRPYVKRHPNLSLYVDSEEQRCTNCLSDILQAVSAHYYTYASKFRTYKCKNCGCYVRIKYRTKMDNPVIVRPIAN